MSARGEFQAFVPLFFAALTGCGIIASPDTTLDLDEDTLQIAILAPSVDQNLTDLSFSDTQAGSSTVLSVTLKNFGELRAQAIEVTITNPDGTSSPYAFAGGTFPGTSGLLSGTCSESLNESVSCTLLIEFAPVSAGTHTGALTLSYFNGLTTIEGELALVGIATP